MLSVTKSDLNDNFKNFNSNSILSQTKKNIKISQDHNNILDINNLTIKLSDFNNNDSVRVI